MGPTAVLLTGLALSTPAAGDTTPGRVVAGPVLSGDGAVWLESRRDGGRLAVRSARPRGESRPVADFPPPRERALGRGVFIIHGLVGSPAGTALAIREAFGGPRDVTQFGAVRLLTGPPNGGLRESARCDPRSSGGFRPTVVAAGDVAAFQVRDCEELQQIQLRSFTGEPLDAPPSGEAALLDAAGSYLAWTAAAGEVTVYDRARGAIAYTARGDGLEELGALGLAPDGRLAAAYRAGAAWGLVVFAADGSPEPVGELRFLRPERVRIAGGRVALTTQLPDGYALTLVDIERAQARRVAHVLRPDFGLQGDRLAWLEPTCRGPRIRQVDAGAMRAGASTIRCAVPLARRPVLDGRTLKLTLRCAVFGTTRCAEIITVATTRAPSRVVADDELLPPPLTRATVRLRLPRRVARAFRAGRLRLRVSATVSDPSTNALEVRRSTLSRSRVTVRR